jgi:hypothetical protein
MILKLMKLGWWLGKLFETIEYYLGCENIMKMG